jgi:RHS repeat-associated protein
VAGQVTLARDFAPFGETVASAGDATTTFGFAGEPQDPTGLIFLQARYHDTIVGRFLAKDPFPGLPALPSTLNPCPCALNNPVNLVDPSWKFVPRLVAAGVAGVTGFNLAVAARAVMGELG